MTGEFGNSKASDTGDSGSNKEMNPTANSSATENDSQDGGQSRSSADVNIEKSETEGKSVDPGRTPGKAEGVEDSEQSGNQ